MPDRKKANAENARSPAPPTPAGPSVSSDGADRLRGLIARLKQLEGEKKLLLVEFEKRRGLRERQHLALVAERSRTEKRLQRIERHLVLLNQASERIQRIVRRLKLIQQQQERLADEILSRLERSAIVEEGEPARLISVPRARGLQSAKEPTRSRPYPSLPGWRRPAGERGEPMRPEPDVPAETTPSGSMDASEGLETLTLREAAEAKAALLSILQDIHAFREKREEIEKEVDRLKHL